ncbi:MAG TPA: CusA/CzcA family heavy metal efflux RND transporter [Spirochaetota bacterium]|nr:CusA/CzcA family heavy metal efflux RND transporter [Spirochaetota bacterium]HPQ53789.1 CusA/CzcA family heavy metal efflux RND transporter [Spirochaetota bacterium]
MKHILTWCLNNRILILVMTAAMLAAGVWSLYQIKLDAIPDLSDTQVIIQANYQGQPPAVVEDQVTYPLTTRMLSVPYAKDVRGYSFFGFSLVYVIFEDGTDLYWARSRVLEYLNGMQGRLPEGVSMELGPDATAIGWIYEYALKDTTGRYTLADLRDLQDFVLRYELTSVKGVSEVASLGGFRRQFQVEVNPNRLYQYKIPLSKIESAIRKSNMEMGARLFQQAETEYMIIAKGYIRTVEDIKDIPIRFSAEGAVLRLGDIAHVKEGPDIRRGIADLNGNGEVVGGIVIMRQGEDVPRTIALIKEKLKTLKSSIPRGIEIVETYDRSELIGRAVHNLAVKIIEELIIVSIVTIFFLLHFRSAFVALTVLPLGVLMSFIIMHVLNVGANIMSMGGIAIAIGVMVDASVVMVENMHKRLEEHERSGVVPDSDLYWLTAKESTLEVAPGLFWSMMIIIVSFLPIFALPEQSGRMFVPLALTKTLAMTASAMLSIMLLPVLVGYFVRGRIPPEERHPVSRSLISVYSPVLAYSLDHKGRIIAAAGALLLISILPVTGLRIPFTSVSVVDPIGSEFMPPLEEGDLLYMPTTIPGISVSKARDILISTDRMIKKIPEVKLVFGKIGRSETATDPAPLSMIETNILLKDRSEWRPGITIDTIIEELDRTVKLPGLVNAWTMPIKARIDMLSTGIKTPLGVKIMGDDLGKLETITAHLEGHISRIPGVSSVFGDRVEGANYINYDIDRRRAGLYGLSIADIQNVLTSAVGGRKVGDVISGLYRWSINIRYLRSYRESLDSLKNIFIPIPSGGQIPVSEVAGIRIEKGPGVIKTENARRTSWLYVDTRSSDIGTVAHRIDDLITKLHAEKKIPWFQGYTYKISGQYEQMKLAAERMKILIPLVILIVFVILFIHFKNVSHPLWIMITALFFAPIGGIWFMFLAGYNRSVASDVGFIALIGLAAETGVIMLVYLDDALKRLKEGKFPSIREAVMHGAVMRVRPKMMTVATTILGLTPIFWGTDAGNTAMRRIASPMVGGLITSTVVTLILIPVIFEWWYERRGVEEYTLQK